MISLRGGSGLGDSLYIQAVARHFARQGHRVEVASDWPDVFRPLLNGRVTVSPFRRENITHIAHYTARKAVAGTSQFEDCCLQAKIAEPVELKLDWTVTDAQFVREIKDRAAGRPVVAVQLPRQPMNRKDGLGRELLPDCRALQDILDALRERAFLVQVGQGKPLHNFEGIELDLANRTTVMQLIDSIQASHACLGYVSFMIPLAESLGKPVLAVWSRRGLRSPTPFIAQITPEKILHAPASRSVMDDAAPDKLARHADALLDAARGGGAVPG